MFGSSKKALGHAACAASQRLQSVCRRLLAAESLHGHLHQPSSSGKQRRWTSCGLMPGGLD
eukprot:1160829-Pelagomonas_calceolata.AAC.8